MDLNTGLSAHLEEIIQIRRHIHMYPELSEEETETAGYIASVLEKYQIPFRRTETGNGIVAQIGNPGNKCVGLRADIDALPVTEETGLPYASKKSGVMHACGHDMHTAILLGTGILLKELEDQLPGAVKLFFQPAEETLFGALKSYDDGVLDDVDYAFGAHVRPIQDIPDGTVCAAVRHTSSTFCIVELKGKVAHGSRPHLGASVVEAAVLATNAVNSLWVNPNKAWSAKVTSIDCASTATNIIPDKGKMILDIRAQDNETMTELLEKLKTAITNACACVNVTCEITFPGGVIPAAVYDEDLVDQVRKTIGEVLGEEKVAKDCGGGGEDFHYFKQKKPELHAAYIGVGTGVTPGLHDPRMTMNPESLRNGVKVLEKLILNVVG